MIEVYPEIGDARHSAATIRWCSASTALSRRRTWPFHLLLSVPLEPEEIERIGAREGWRTKTFGRGMQGSKPFFHVIEFWLENRLMIEVVSPEMAREYEEFSEERTADDDGDPRRAADARHAPQEPA